jgi:hypothetical protein
VVLPSPQSSRLLSFTSERACHWLAGIFFLGLALVYYLPSLTGMPRGIHEWAQADRLALAISFYDNGLHFFRPQTLNLSALDGVVGVEFPLVAWLVAVLAKVTGRGSIVLWFHLLDIGTAVAGYYFLFRLVFERGGNFVAALLPGVFLATAPVFAYYAGNYLPDPVGASLVVVASYFLLRFGQQFRFADLVGALVLYTLATLIKTSAGTYQLAAIGLVLLWSYLRADLLSFWQKLLLLALSALSVGVVVAYARYNAYLNEAYHSYIFLANARPIKTAQEYEDVMRRIQEVWWVEYFTEAHYFLLKCSAVVCVLFGWRIVRTEWLWASLLALAAVGGYAFFRLMGLQFFDHDYYVLAPYYPGLALLVALAAVQVASWRGWPGPEWTGRGRTALRVAQYALATTACASLLVLGLTHYRARTADTYLRFSDYYRYRWMEGGAAALAAAQVPTSATLLVLDEGAPNLALVYFDRRGINWNPDLAKVTPDEITDYMRNNGLDYLLLEQPVFSKLPALPSRFRVLLRTPSFVLLAPATPTR